MWRDKLFYSVTRPLQEGQSAESVNEYFYNALRFQADIYVHKYKRAGGIKNA